MMMLFLCNMRRVSGKDLVKQCLECARRTIQMWIQSVGRNWSKITQELVTNCSGNAELGKNCQELLLDITLSFKMLIKLLPSLNQDTRRAS